MSRETESWAVKAVEPRPQGFLPGISESYVFSKRKRRHVYKHTCPRAGRATGFVEASVRQERTTSSFSLAAGETAAEGPWLKCAGTPSLEGVCFLPTAPGGPWGCARVTVGFRELRWPRPSSPAWAAPFRLPSVGGRAPGPLAPSPDAPSESVDSPFSSHLCRPAMPTSPGLRLL